MEESPQWLPKAWSIEHSWIFSTGISSQLLHTSHKQSLVLLWLRSFCRTALMFGLTCSQWWTGCHIKSRCGSTWMFTCNHMWKVHLALHNFRGGDGVPTEFWCVCGFFQTSKQVKISCPPEKEKLTLSAPNSQAMPIKHILTQPALASEVCAHTFFSSVQSLALPMTVTN